MSPMLIVIPTIIHFWYKGKQNEFFFYYRPDHILISQNLYNYVAKYCSLGNEIDNQSDHVSLVMTLNVESKTEHINVSIKIYTSIKVWNRTNSEHINDYRIKLDDCLLSFTLHFDSLQCTDLLCIDKAM